MHNANKPVAVRIKQKLASHRAGRSLIFHARTAGLQLSNALGSIRIAEPVTAYLDWLCIPQIGPRIKRAEMSEVLARHPGYRDIAVFIETGTLEAANVVNLGPAFREAHSIELSPTLYRAAIKRFGPNTRFGIHFHHGDSAKVLPRLLEKIAEPAVVYLDGHYFKSKYTAAAEFPLWSELAALAKRRYNDVVIVDDVHTFGRERPDLTARESGRSWQHVTTDSILDALGRDRVVDSFILRDEFVIYRRAVPAA